MSERRQPTATAVEAGPERRQVRVWELPVRVVHWTLFASIGVLTVTGLYIAYPWLAVDAEFLMGWVRGIHIISGWVLIAALLARAVWMFQGNRWARWDQFVPARAERRRGWGDSLRYYTFLRRDPPPEIGHNPLAGTTYLVLFLMLGFQGLTGAALSTLHLREGAVWAASGWIFSIFTVPTVRMLHHLIMWLTIGFVVHHVYSAWLTDVEERNGLISSIFTGRKHVSADLVEDERD